MSNSRFSFTVTGAEILIPRLQYITHSKYEADWHSITHTHPFPEFIFIENGEGTYIVGSDEYQVHTGNLIIIPPNRRHTEQSSRIHPLEYYAMGVTNISLHLPHLSSSDENTVRPLIFQLGGQTERGRNLFADIYREMKNEAEGYPLMITSLLFQFIVFLLRQTSVTTSAETQQTGRQDFAAVKEYIDEHYSDRITLEYLAGMVNTSKYHLVHKFTQQMGCPPITYLIKKRISEAKLLLTSTQMSIADIAYAVGFPSACQFSQRFKQEFGCAPCQYRRNTENNSPAQ